MENTKYKQAVNLLTQHDCGNSRTILARENCGACVLNGFHDTEQTPIAPNYSGWARVYVQACKQIPRKYAGAFMFELSRTDNIPYVEALKEDVINYGVIIL